MSNNLNYQETALYEMYAQKIITGKELEELQGCLHALYRFNRKVMIHYNSETWKSEDHIETTPF